MQLLKLIWVKFHLTNLQQLKNNLSISSKCLWFFSSCQRYWKIQSSQVVRPFHTPTSVEYGQSIISICRCCFLFIDAVFIAQYYANWTRNVLILTKFSSLTALEVVILTTSSAASDENFISMIILLWYSKHNFVYKSATTKSERGSSVNL